MTILVRPGKGRPSDSKVLRPIRMGWLSVSALKCARSSGRRQGRRFSMPMTRFFASAAMTLMRGLCWVMNGLCPSIVRQAHDQGGRWSNTCGYLPAHLPLATHLNSHRRLDRRVRVVALEREILVAEAKDVRHVRVELHRRQGPRRAGKLLARLVEVVEVEMRIAQRVNEVAGCKASRLRHHHRQQRVARDVERHAEEDVGAALVE